MGMMIFRPGQRLIIPGVQVFQPRVTSAAASGILDGISNIAAAYGLRKLRTAYAGSAVRVRRSSDSTEQDIGFDGTGEFDSAAFSSFIGGGTGYVKTWYDQGGNGRDATQTTTTNQPSILLSGINSKPVVSFSGAGSLLSNTFTTQAQPFSWVHISQQADTSNLIPVSGGGSNLAIWYNGNGTFYAGAPFGGGQTVTNSIIYSVVANGVSSKVWYNGGGMISGNSGGGTYNRYEIGGWGGGYLFSGKISEWFALSTAISTTDHNTVGADMATRFGLSWTTVT